MVAPSGERLRGKGRYGVFAGLKLCDPYLRGEVLTIGRYTNLRTFTFRGHTYTLFKARHISKIRSKFFIERVKIYYAYRFYGLECFSLIVSDIKSLDFTVTRFLMKLFKSSNINLIMINDSRYYFNFELPSERLMKRKDKFIEKFMASQSLLDYFAIQ